MAAVVVSGPLLLPTAPASALAGPPVADTGYTFTAKLAIGDTFRSCTGTLINAQWILTASSCFAENPDLGYQAAPGAPKWKTTATIGLTRPGSTVSQVRDVVELVPRADRDLVLAKLASPVTGIAPLRVGATAPTQGEQMQGAGYGRTKDTWVPDTLHTGAFTVNQVDGTQLLIDGTPVCKGDTGAPVLREKNGLLELAAVASTSWQGGCLGSASTRTGAGATRVDDLAGWVKQSTSSTLTPWRLQMVATTAGKNLFHTIRDSNWDWSAFGDVEQEAGDIGEVAVASDAAISGSNTIVALGKDGTLYQAVRNPDGTWVAFRPLTTELGALAGVKKIAATSVGSELQLVAITDSRVYHATRDASGQWSKWGDLTAGIGALPSPTQVTIARVGDSTHVGVVLADGRAFHTIRHNDRTWDKWGEITKVPGAPAKVSDIAFAGTGNDLQAVLTEPTGGIKHVARLSTGTWTAFGDLAASVLGTGPVTAVAATSVDGEFHTAIIRDGVIKHTMRHTNGTWEPADTPPGAPADPTTLAITGSWN
ncbi:trypsin-like serine protease [Streptomyces sp. NPDC056160]|uniref:trypsin-like serine protease n=1 Tax=Streptomyces sp. NPDC056160 TaxID=3345731 RepID=UPI0035E20C44